MRITTAGTRKILGFDDTWFMVSGVLLISFFLPLLFFGGTLANGLVAYAPKFGISLIYTVAYWISMRAIFINLRRRYPTYTQTQKRVGYTILMGFATYLILNHLLDFLIHGCFGGLGEEEPPEFVMNAVSLTLILTVGALYESVFLYNRWKESIIEKEKLERIHFQSQLEGLRNQVNPHFLFNSLNTLSYIIPEDPERAVKFVQKLSKVYRYILEIRDKKLISLEEELRFLQSYLFLLKERFGENLVVQIDIPAHLYNELIVPLSLQLLFENAIKHNIISSTTPLAVEVLTEHDDTLIIRNNLQRKQQEQPSTQVGLTNIKERYAFFSDRPVAINETEDYFVVRLPLIKADITTSQSR